MCLAFASVVVCHRYLQHKPHDAHSLKVPTKKDRHLYGGHWKKGCHRLLQQRQASDSQLAESRSSQEHLACLPPSSFRRCICSHVVNSSNDNGIISCTETARSWKPSSLSRVHDVATDTSAETRKVEGKLDALVNLVTQLAVNQKPASVARRRWFPTPRSFGARIDAIVIRGVHDVVSDTSAETRKVEGKLDALVNLVTQLAVNQKPASVARVCGIRSSNDNHTNVCPSS
ncbi:hypothetical protein Fmac_024849 [Flemingia macrophylla]|uniref:Uncharacterized protein n=1 Tax=Flemingia macrophylla TaxID=520843 RepID=A0ABD1LQN0_9FABA